MEVAGYAISDDGRVLDLAVAATATPARPFPRSGPQAVPLGADVRRPLPRRPPSRLEESSPAYDMAQAINAQWPQLGKIRIFLLTDGRTSISSLPEERIGDLPVQQNLWDIERLRRLATSGRLEEAITIDLPPWAAPCAASPPPARKPTTSACSPSCPASCSPTCTTGTAPSSSSGTSGPSSSSGARSTRASSRLSGQPRATSSPTTTASPRPPPPWYSTSAPDGTYLVKLDDLQIVNGGQTTATLHHAAVREGADLSHVQVPAKITVVPPDQLDQLVPKISRYANSQNAIAEADFESNNPFHVELERLSRTIWAPAPAGETRQSHWYYERVRGQYQVDRARQQTPARRRSFDEQNPTAHKFTKTDAAKYDMTFRQQPHVVSLGAQKCFQAWTVDVLAARTALPNDHYFHNMVAKAILFEQARKHIQRWNPGAGYLANVTTYTVARLVMDIDKDAVLLDIWRQQKLPPTSSTPSGG